MTDYPLTLLYDGACPFCTLEIDNLKTRNQQNLLCFIDISTTDFDAEQYGIPKEELMRTVHAIKSDDRIAKGVEVLRLAYAAVGLGWMAAATAWPVLKPVCDWAYRHLARNRYRLSERFSGVLYFIAARRANQKTRACHSGHCTLPP